jgi:hypothetical protein
LALAAPARPGARSGGENARVADRGGGGGDLDRDALSDVAQALLAELCGRWSAR